MRTIIKQAHVIDPSQRLDGIYHIVIKDGKIEQITPEESVIDDMIKAHTDITVIDAKGLVAVPGLVDMHVHLRDPGFTDKEDIFSGCASAAAGGVTALLCMPNTKPVIDNAETIGYITQKAKTAAAKVYPAACITQNMAGDALTDFAMLKRAGAIALTDDGRPVANAAVMQAALQQAYQQGLVVTSHCEDLDIIQGGIINEGEVSQALGVKGMHRSSEDTITAREIALAANTDTAVHIAHVSTWYATQLIREAKKNGIRVTAETCPHYFSLTQELLHKRDADYRMNPPLREQADVEAILQGIADGTFDAIVTDHAPHTPQEKADFETAPNGVIGMETSFSASYTYLVKSGVISLYRLIELMSTNPAKILQIEAGSLAPGRAADIALIDLNRTWVPRKETSHSKAQNIVYKGITLHSKVVRTLLNGNTVYEA